MTLTDLIDAEGPLVRQYEYGDDAVLAVDFGPGTETAIDVVDGTVIVVTGDEHHEFELPAGANDADTFIRNGVLSIELEATE